MGRYWIAAGLFCALVAGCNRSQPYLSPQRAEKGLAIVLPGIEGRGLLNEAICTGLNKGGIDWAIELYDWTTGVPGNYLYHLRAESRNRREAIRIAERVQSYSRAHPGRPVVLVGQSGGGAIAVWAAEALPLRGAISGIVLLAPALSPGYDLAPALDKTQRGIVSFYSPRDWIFLGMGTSIYGTMDGKYTQSAGRVSFRTPEIRRRPAYAKLFQASWNRDMSETGYTGGHLSSGAEKFVATYVAPLLRADRWDEELLLRVLTREPPPPRRRLPPPEQWRVEPRPDRGSPSTRPRGRRPPPSSRPRPTTRPATTRRASVRGRRFHAL